METKIEKSYIVGSVDLTEYVKRNMGLINMKNVEMKIDEIKIDNINKALEGILYIFKTIKETAGDGFQLGDVFVYGSLVGKIIDVAKAMPEALEEKDDLNDTEMTILIEKFTEQGLKLIGIGTGANQHGTDYTVAAFQNLADIIISVKQASLNGIGVEDVVILPTIISKAVMIVVHAKDISNELGDLTASEIAKLLAMLAAKVLYIIKG